MTTKERLIQRAQTFLRKKFNDTDIDLGLQMARELEQFSIFTYARRVRHRIFKANPANLKNLRKLAVATYKDEDLPADRRYDVAANLIYKNYGKTPETIHHYDAAGILGSIFKRKWRNDSQIKHLFRSLEFYQRGFELFEEGETQGLKEKIADLETAIFNLEKTEPVGEGELKTYKEKLDKLTAELKQVVADYEPFNDEGYNAINVAFVCDLLITQHPEETGKEDDPCSFIPIKFKELAKQARTRVQKYCLETEPIIKVKAKQSKETAERKKAQGKPYDTAPSDLYWFYVTWAEALLGLNEPKEAAARFADALGNSPVEKWKLESSGRQLTELVALLYPETDLKDKASPQAREAREAREALAQLLGEKPAGDPARKLGLALSGGGFRASIFHIGVLAKLAENDLLKDVEVISCVSGGSIIGAYYYLKIKHLLETNPDKDITKEDYVAIVRDIESKFLEGVSTNLRMRIFDNLYRNVIIGVKDAYTRTARLADLYEQELYAPLLPKKEGSSHIYMDDLFIKPFDKPNFNIRFDNICRNNKVPMLVLNATSLNTGHCWQFTASWMGEPPGYINNELDARPTYRRMYYSEAPEKFRKVRLATAVSASSAVPGLFSPVTFEGLYANGTTLQLVDGGVYDNQGIISLNEQDCNDIIVSDASGQMAAEDAPGSSAVSVFGRMSSILQERLRDYAFYDLQARHSAGSVKGYLLMHLTKGLPSDVIEWDPCDDRYEFNDDDAETKQDLTSYEIRKDVQIALARIRTDLDSFHQLESYALMYSGYKMTGYEMAKGRGSLLKALEQPNSSGWQFEDYAPVHDNPETSKVALKKLQVSSGLFGKLLSLSSALKWVTILTPFVLLFLWDRFYNDKHISQYITVVQCSIVGLILSGAILADLFLHKRNSLVGWIAKVAIGIPLLTLLWLLFWPMRFVFNGVYLRLGRVRKVLQEKK